MNIQEIFGSIHSKEEIVGPPSKTMEMEMEAGLATSSSKKFRQLKLHNKKTLRFLPLALSELEKSGKLREIERQYNNQSNGSRERKRRAKHQARNLLQQLDVPTSEIEVVVT